MNTHSAYQHMDAVLVAVSGALQAIVDSQDADRVRMHRWKMTRSVYGIGYAITKVDGKTVSMHRLIFGQSCDGSIVDHINGNTLDNRRCNLRIADDAQNQWNRSKRAGRSKFKGVCFHAKSGKWMSRIAVRKRRIQIGLFDSEEAAGRAYDAAAMQHFGEFARCNFESQREVGRGRATGTNPDGGDERIAGDGDGGLPAVQAG